MRDIGKNIKQLRQLKKMTQDELAEKLFVTRQTISNYETGKSRPDIEMLIRIAETLETDPNTVLYGTEQQVNRQRMIWKLVISVAVLVIALIGFGHLAKLANELAQWSFDQRLAIFCRLFAWPLLAFLFGWTAMQALGVFAKLSPLADPWGKRLRWITVGTAVGYILILAPIIVTFIMEISLGTLLNGFIGRVWSYAAWWIAGFFPVNAFLKPNIVLFGILGCTLWLGIPQKTKE